MQQPKVPSISIGLHVLIDFDCSGTYGFGVCDARGTCQYTVGVP